LRVHGVAAFSGGLRRYTVSIRDRRIEIPVN